MGDTRSSHSMSVQDEMVTPQIDAWASAPISSPRAMSLQSIDQGGVEVIMVSHIF